MQNARYTREAESENIYRSTAIGTMAQQLASARPSVSAVNRDIYKAHQANASASANAVLMLHIWQSNTAVLMLLIYGRAILQ